MSKFRKNTPKKKVQISTASLPDIVFMMLFFFMVSATIKSNEEIVKTKIPQAREVTSAERKNLVKELKIGKPINTAAGETYKIVAGDKFLKLDQIKQWVNEKRDELPEVHKNQLIVMLKADEGVSMGFVSDVQQELRKSNARKILYRTLNE